MAPTRLKLTFSFRRNIDLHTPLAALAIEAFDRLSEGTAFAFGLLRHNRYASDRERRHRLHRISSTMPAKRACSTVLIGPAPNPAEPAATSPPTTIQYGQ